MPPLVIIDRDGTLNVEKHYLSAPDQVELLPRAAEAVKLLRELGLPIVVVTNQSGVGRGFFDEARLAEIHRRLVALLAAEGAQVDAIYFCPHTPDGACECRKPATKMARQAAAEFGANLAKSFVIGDNDCDILLGKNIGATTILVRTGHGARTAQARNAIPDHTVDDLYEAAKVIVEILKGKNLRPS